MQVADEVQSSGLHLYLLPAMQCYLRGTRWVQRVVLPVRAFNFAKHHHQISQRLIIVGSEYGIHEKKSKASGNDAEHVY